MKAKENGSRFLLRKVSKPALAESHKKRDVISLNIKQKYRI
jgi:hypothetical protein